MGFYEDDRIRNKNRAQNEAYETYEALKTIYDDSYIIKYTQFALSSTNDPFRTEVLNIITRIAKGRSNETPSNTDN